MSARRSPFTTEVFDVAGGRTGLSPVQIELKAEDLYDKEKRLSSSTMFARCFSAKRLVSTAPRRSSEHNAGCCSRRHRAPDRPDFVGLVFLLSANSAVGFYEERNAGNAVRPPMDSLASKARVGRNSIWSEIDSELVPGNVVAFKIGGIVSADCSLTQTINTKKAGDQCFLGSTCEQGEAERVVVSTGANTFFGRAASLVGQDDHITGHLQKFLAQIGSFCLICISIFVAAEIIVLHAGFCSSYRHRNIFVLVIGGIPIAMPTALSVTRAVGAQQLAKHKATVTRITAIEESTDVTILCSVQTGTLTTNKLAIDRSTIKTYGPFSADDVILLTVYASRIDNQGAIDMTIVAALGDVGRARAGTKLLDYKPFSKLKCVTKDTTRIELCMRNRTQDLENRLKIDDFSAAYAQFDGDEHEAQGTDFKLIGLLSLLDLPTTKQTSMTLSLPMSRSRW
ncbi:E1-E2 ATPase-domain-containing protein [Schizophyllum amplum]|uniref:E1-E2 ATPase-domain-containing protein n=1 Tax=Schizophyllum amplum TaxID=97359 RepID=A0A550BTN3_9AGAR|nr:E1-E2 ATPase-domain-containing protein [Auriculariopsis ampla]